MAARQVCQVSSIREQQRAQADSRRPTIHLQEQAAGSPTAVQQPPIDQAVLIQPGIKEQDNLTPHHQGQEVGIEASRKR